MISGLEPSKAERQALRKELIEYTDDFLEALSDEPAYVAGKYDKTAEDHQFEIDGDIKSFKEMLQLMVNRVDSTGLNPASGGHLGYIPGGGIYTAALGDYIAAVTNRYAGVFFASPGAVRMENALIDWVGKTLGYQEGFGGNLTSGGSLPI